MRTASEIREMLDLLNAQPADTLEDQDLDFKEWRMRSHVDAVRDVIDMAICMANGGGGTAVFGVKDNITGRASAVLGVPPEVDVNQLRRDIYNSTDPKITPVFETLAVPEGTGRLIIMQIHPGLPPYTDTAGRAKIRIGKDCQPLTGTLRSRFDGTA